MPIKPEDQQRAMFTVQRGPKKIENDMSVSVDASSIEPAEPLDEVFDPVEREESRTKQTKIIALLGLDTISTAVGFDDFMNYFTLRSIESDLCQEIIEEHIKNYNPGGEGDIRNRGDRTFLSSAVKESREQRRVCNLLLKIQKSIHESAQGIGSMAKVQQYANSDIDDQLRTKGGPRNVDSYKFLKSEKNNVGVPESLFDRIEKFLGLSEFRTQRPSFQYLKLCADANSMLVPRTCPTYYNDQVRRPMGDVGYQSLTSYTSTTTGWSSEGTANIESNGLDGLELSVKDLQGSWRIQFHRNDHVLLGRDKVFKNLGNHSMLKNFSALMYVTERDHEMSQRLSPTNFSKTHTHMSTPRASGLMMDEALEYSATISAEGDRNILLGIGGSSIEYQVEDKESQNRTRWYKVLSLENIGVQQFGRRGRSPRSPHLVSPAQINQAIYGTPNAVENLEKIAEEQHQRAFSALHALDESGATGFHKDGIDTDTPVSIVDYVGKFLEDLQGHIGRMLRTAENSSPSHFQTLKQEGEDTADGGSGVFDLARWKAYGRDTATIPEYNAENRDRGWANPFVARQWRKQADTALYNALSQDIRGHIGFLRSRFPNHDNTREALNEIESLWQRIQNNINDSGVYDAAASGVINLSSEIAPNKAWQFASQRMSMGLAMVLATMKHRHYHGGSRFRYMYYPRLFSRFRFAVFSNITQDTAGLTSADSSLAFDATGGKQNFGAPKVVDDRSVPLSFRDAYSAEGGAFLTRPLITNGTNLPNNKVHTIAEVTQMSDSDKIEFFGYIKSSPGAGSKFRIPTGQFRSDYGQGNESGDGLDLQASIQDAIGENELPPNDISAFADIYSFTGYAYDALNTDQSGRLFAINMAPGQAEEYFEIGWNLVGEMVAKYIKDMSNNMNDLGMLAGQGVTNAGGQGLDTYLTIFFETLGMIADAIPVSVCNSAQFHQVSPDKGSSVLLEDTDLRNSLNERSGGMYNDTIANLFFSKSGIDADPDGQDNPRRSQVYSTMQTLYRNVAAAKANSRSEDSISFDGYHQNGFNPDGNPSDTRGTLNWDVNTDANTIGYLNMAINAATRDLDRQGNRAPTQDIAIVFPRRLKAILPESSGYQNFSSTSAIKSIGKYMRTGRIPGQFEYEKSGHRHSITATYKRVDGSNTAMTHEIYENYVQACSNYFENLSIDPSVGSLGSLMKLTENLAYNDFARKTIQTTLRAYNTVVTDQTSKHSTISSMVDSLGNQGSDEPILHDAMKGLRAQRNISNFDTATSDRPWRTIAKMNPRGMATSEMNYNHPNRGYVPGTDYDPDIMMKLSTSSEFTNTTKNLIIAYLDNYPIVSSKETIIVAGCPAGSDTKNLGSHQKGLFGFRGRGPMSMNPTRDPYSSGSKRVFRVTVERDLQTDEQNNAQFTVERHYQMKYFLLPESFEGITDNDLFDVSDEKGWIRAIAKRAKWFRRPNPNSIDKTSLMDSLETHSWRTITFTDHCHEALDDMVESHILKWMTAMVSGVMLDQDLMFEETDGARSVDLLAPGTYSAAVSKLEEKGDSENGTPILGFPNSLIPQLFRSSPIPTNVAYNDISGRNLNNLGFSSQVGERMGFVTDDAATSLVMDTYRTELDPETGAEIRVPINAEIKPWNIRLTSSLLNSFMYKAPLITSVMTAKPAFDYMMFMRIKARDFFLSATSPVELLSFRVEITNGAPLRRAEG